RAGRVSSDDVRPQGPAQAGRQGARDARIRESRQSDAVVGRTRRRRTGAGGCGSSRRAHGDEKVINPARKCESGSMLKSGFFVAAMVLAASPANAHITLETRQAAVGSYYKAVFAVPHGCAGSPTIKIR